MPLQEQYIEIPLTGGIDEKANKEGDVSGFFGLENCEYDDTDSIRRRHGFVLQSAWSSTTGHALVAAGNSIAAIDDSGARPFSNGQIVGAPNKVNPTSHISRATYWNGRRVYSCDIAGSNSYYLVALAEYVENTASIRRQISWKLVERVSGTAVNSGTIAGTGDGAFYPRCACIGGTSGTVFQLFWVEGTVSAACSLKGFWIDVSASTAASTTILLDADVKADVGAVLLDVCPFVSSTYVTYFGWSSHNVRVLTLGTGLSGSTPFNDTTSTYTSINGSLAIAVNAEVTVIYGDGADVQASVYDQGLTTRQRGTKGGTPVYTGGGSFFGNIGACISVTSGTSHVVVVLVQIASGDNHTQTYNASTNAVTATATTTAYTAVTKPFVAASNSYYAGFQANNALQSGFPNILVCDVVTPSAHGQLAFEEAGTTFGSVAVYSLSSQFLTACVVAEETADAANSALPVSRVRVVEMSRQTAALPVAPLNGDGFVGGSLPRVWDGSTFSLAGFVTAPTPPTLATFGTGLTGTFSYCVMYEYSDARGNIGVSPVSLVRSIMLANQGVAVTGTIPLFADPNRPIRVKIYRTTAGGSTFFLAFVFVVTSPGGFTYADTVGDTLLSTAEILYTTGGVLASELVPPLSSVTTHGNRLFGLRSDDPRTIAFTKETTDPFLPQWNSVLTLRVDNEGGTPQVVASLDDKVVIFQTDQITAFNGTGPDATGVGSYSVPEVVARGVGVDPSNVFSVCVIPDGVLFRHASGVYMLDRSMAVSPVGLPVQRTLGTHAIVRSRYLTSRHQAWFILDDGSILVFDTRYQRWSHFSFTFASVFSDVLEVAGTVYLLASNAGFAQCELWKLDTSTYVDKSDGTTATYFPQVMKLPWFRGAGRNGAQRLWKVGLHGELVNGAGVSVTVDAYTQKGTELAKNAEVRDTRYTFSSLSAYPAGGLRLPVRAVSQRCDAFRCDITITPSTTDAEGFRLNKVSYTYGTEPGKGKAPLGRKPSAS